MSIKCQKITYWSLGILGILMVLLTCFMPLIFPAILKSQVTEQILMQNSSFSLWGEVPGESGVNLLRNFTFYELQNGDDFFYRGETPIFKQRTPQAYSEITTFMEPTYSDDQVSYYLQRTYQPFDQKDENFQFQEQYDLMNIAAISVWSQIKSANNTLLGLQGMGMTSQNLSNLVIPQIQSFGINGMFLKDNVTAYNILSPLGLSNESISYMWNDENYGLGSKTTLLLWAYFGNEGFPGGTGKILQDYFKLTPYQLQALHEQFSEWNKAVNQTGIYNGYCQPLEPYNDGKPVDCDGKLLYAIQMTTQNITFRPPKAAGVKPFPSITTYNDTISGYPEMTNWLENTQNGSGAFNNINPLQCPKIAFWFKEVFNFLPYNPAKNQTDFVKGLNNLLNFGSMELLIQTANQAEQLLAEQKIVESNQMYNKIYDQLKMSTFVDSCFGQTANQTQWAKFFMTWFNYIINDFIAHRDLRGSPAEAGAGAFAASAIQNAWQQNSIMLLPFIQAKMVRNMSKYTTCSDYFQNTLYNLTKSNLDLLCVNTSLIDFPSKPEPVYQLIEFCKYQTGDLTSKLPTILTRSQIVQLCNPEGGSFGQLFDQIQQILTNLYKCLDVMGQYCSNTQIAIFQWQSSLITLNPPPQSNLAVGDTSALWNITSLPWEYFYFYKHNKTSSNESIWAMNYTVAKQLMTYQFLFSQTKIQLGFVFQQTGKQQNFTDIFLTPPEYQSQLIDYFRFMAVEYSWGGLSLKKPMHAYLFGWIDPIITGLKEMDPQIGGNPSIPNCVLLNDPNITAQNEQIPKQYQTCAQYNYYNFSTTMSTGKNNINSIRQYQKIWGYDYITMNFSWFNGNETINATVTPWAANISFGGTDGQMNRPFIDTSGKTTLPTYITQSYCGPEMISDGQKQDIYDLETLKYYPNPVFFNNVSNQSVYYQYKYQGYLNLTNIQRGPVFVSQPHFYQAPDLNNSCVYISEQGDVIQANDYDESYAKIEPTTGTTINAQQNSQINLLIEPFDPLFSKLTGPKMLPVFNMFRGGNWTESSISAQFGQLITVQKVKWAIYFVPLGIGAALLLIATYFFIRVRNALKLEKENNQEKLDHQKNLLDSEQSGQNFLQYSEQENANQNQQQQNMENYA